MGNIAGTALGMGFGVPGLGTALSTAGHAADFANTNSQAEAMGIAPGLGLSDVAAAALNSATFGLFGTAPTQATMNAYGLSPQGIADLSNTGWGRGSSEGPDPDAQAAMPSALATALSAANNTGLGTADAYGLGPGNSEDATAAAEAEAANPSAPANTGFALGGVGVAPGDSGSANAFDAAAALSAAISSPGSGIALSSPSINGYASYSSPAGLADGIDNPGTENGIGGWGSMAGRGGAAAVSSEDAAEGAFSSDSDGGGGDGGGGSVICTELHRRGVLSDAVYEADELEGREQPREVIAGYHWWGIPYARLMRRSKLAFAVGKILGSAWAHEMAARRKVDGVKSTRLGRFLVKYGPPVCGAIGKVRQSWFDAAAIGERDAREPGASSDRRRIPQPAL